MGKQTDFDYGHNIDQPDYGTNDPPTYDAPCMGMLVCPHCGKSAMCSDVFDTISNDGGNDSMIPRGNNQQTNSGRGQGKRNGLPFLSTKDATTMHQPAKIVAARLEDDTYRPGNQVVALKLNYRGQLWLYNLRTNNPTLDTLCNGFGDDESTWSGRNIEIFNEEDSFNGKLWLRLEPSNDVTTEETTPNRKRKVNP
jgi:hypothetical protein